MTNQYFYPCRVAWFMAVLLQAGIATSAVAAGVDPPSIPKGQSLQVPVFTPLAERDFAPPVQKSAAVSLFSEDFETGGTRWGRTGSWQIGAPTSGPMGGFNSSNAAATNLAGNYPSNANDTLTSPAIALTTVSITSDFALVFNEWYQTESCCDKGYVEISTDSGATWTQLSVSSGTSVWRESSISLNSYAGRSVLIRFRFNSDPSTTNLGWYIDNVWVTRTTRNPIEVSITSLNQQHFPFIYMGVDIVDNGAGCATPIPKSGFLVQENGTVQTDYFDVIPPSQGQGIRLADIVFLMDNSGSMDVEQAAIQQNVFAFVNALSGQGVDYALGLTRYGAFADDGGPLIEDNGSLTSDPNYFKNIVWARNIASGAIEPGYETIQTSATAFQFRPGAARFFIIITDETPDQSAVTLQQARTALDTNDIQLFALTLTDLYTTFTGLVDDPANQIFNILSPFDGILAAISSQIASGYLVTYRSSTPVFNNTERLVHIAVSCSSYTGASDARYTPGSVPRIVQTANTLALSASAQPNGTALTIAATITDTVAPLVQSATLLYRTTGATGGYKTVNMSKVGSTTVYQGQIPGTDVVGPGVDYYITATDGVVTTSDPSVNPATYPYQIAVTPNVAPVITHTRVTNGRIGQAVPVTAVVVDTTDSVASVSLNYRRFGSLTFNSLAMTAGSNNSYSASIPGTAMTIASVEYFLKAMDTYQLASLYGTPDAPLYISLPPIVTTSAATSVAATSATLNATVVANGANAAVTFDFGTTTSYGTSVTATPNTVSAGASNTLIKASRTSLACNTSYHYRVKAVSTVATSYGVDSSFKTAICPPTVTSNTATNITATSATLRGSVTPNGAVTTVSFEVGPTTSYGTNIVATPNSISAGTTTATVITGTATGLSCNTTYNYRIKAVNSVGTTSGANSSFKTGLCPTDLTLTLSDGRSNVSVGSTLTYLAVVKNAGPAAANNAILKAPAVANLTLSSITCGATLGNAVCPTSLTITGLQGTGLVIPTLPNAGGVTFTINATVAATAAIGTLTYTTVITAPNGDTNLANNTAIDADRLVNWPDLLVTGIVLTPTTPTHGGTFSAAVTLKNQGASTLGFYADVWANQPTARVCAAEGDAWTDVSGLAAGASTTITLSLPAGAAGTKTLRAFIDSFCEIAESNESNNQFTKSYTVQ